MANKTKPKTVYYKRAQFTDPKIILQDELENLLESTCKEVESRSETFTEDEKIFRVINRHDKVSSTLFGQFIVFEPERKQPLLEIDSPHSEYYPLQAKSSEENEAYADEVFYFGVRGNSLACIQTRSISARVFETYLNWLLGTKADIMDGNTRLEILNQPEKKIYDRVATENVKSVKIGSSLFAEESIVDGQNEQEETRRFQFAGRAAEVLKGLLGVQQFNKLRFEEDFDEANLHLYVELKFLRKTTDSGQRAVDEIASAFRHADDVDFEIQLKGGSSIKGAEMNITKKINMSLTQSGLVDEHNLYLQMHEFLIGTLEIQDEI